MPCRLRPAVFAPNSVVQRRRTRQESGERAACSLWDDPVPTLFRLFFVIGLIVALGYGAMLALVTFVQPQPREISQSVPLPKGMR